MVVKRNRVAGFFKALKRGERVSFASLKERSVLSVMASDCIIAITFNLEKKNEDLKVTAKSVSFVRYYPVSTAKSVVMLEYGRRKLSGRYVTKKTKE
jgi:hypothetical protein